MKQRTYIGTYTSGGSIGIYACQLDLTTGELQLTEATPSKDPSFLVLHPNGQYLYAVNEVEQGAISAYAIQPETGRLALLNQQATHGASPCHICMDPGGRCLLVTNYGGSTVAVLPIQADGTLGEATHVVTHEGAARVNPSRQERPHPHSSTLEPAGPHAYVADLGLDRIMVYQLEPEAGRLVPAETPWVAARPGAGPRHFTWHPDHRFLYVVGELDSTVTAFRHGDILTPIQTVSTLPPEFAGDNTGADIHVHPSGRFLYASNRGHDSIAVYRIDPATGALAYVSHCPTGGRNPRNFAVDSTGTFLLAANQSTDTVVTFRIDPETGSLTPTGYVLKVPMPVCVRFA